MIYRPPKIIIYNYHKNYLKQNLKILKLYRIQNVHFSKLVAEKVKDSLEQRVGSLQKKSDLATKFEK